MILLTCYSINSTATTRTSCGTCTCICTMCIDGVSNVHSYTRNSSTSAETTNMVLSQHSFNSTTMTLSATLTIACIVQRWSHVEFSVYKISAFYTLLKTGK